MTTNTLDDYLTGGAKAFFSKNSVPGESVTGKIVNDPNDSIRQITDFVTGEKKSFDDGKPMMQAVLMLQTELREGPEDDGLRTVYIKLFTNQKRALTAASQAAGRGPRKGDVFTAKYVGEGKAEKGYPPKLYDFTIQPGSNLDAALGVQSAAAPAAAPTAEQFPAALTDSQKTLIAQLIAVGQTDAQIAQVVSAPENLVAGARLQLVAAGSGAGF